jgi:c-di-GMP-binding flagellar brake protein YcgR
MITIFFNDKYIIYKYRNKYKKKFKRKKEIIKYTPPIPEQIKIQRKMRHTATKTKAPQKHHHKKKKITRKRETMINHI